MILTGMRTEFGSDAARRLLARHELDSLDGLFSAGVAAADGPKIGSNHAGRQVFRRTLVEENGQPTTVYVKLQEGRRRLWPRMNDLRSGQVFQTLAAREWCGIEHLERLGIPAPERLGLFESPRWSIWHRAAVVVRSVRPERSIDEMLASGEWNRLARSDQDAILEAVVDALSRIHAAGLGWRGSSSRHFFPERTTHGAWRTWLIDCEGIHKFAGPKVFRRNFDKLTRAFVESGADADTMNRLQSRIAHRPAAMRRLA